MLAARARIADPHEGRRQAHHLPLMRLRFHMLRTLGGDTRELLAEECSIVGFDWVPEQAAWLAHEQADATLGLRQDP